MSGGGLEEIRELVLSEPLAELVGGGKNAKYVRDCLEVYLARKGVHYDLLSHKSLVPWHRAASSWKSRGGENIHSNCRESLAGSMSRQRAVLAADSISGNRNIELAAQMPVCMSLGVVHGIR